MPCTDALEKTEVCAEAKGVRGEETLILPVWKEQGTKCRKTRKQKAL